jgi:hypothetical protein
VEAAEGILVLVEVKNLSLDDWEEKDEAGRAGGLVFLPKGAATNARLKLEEEPREEPVP